MQEAAPEAAITPPRQAVFLPLGALRRESSAQPDPWTPQARTAAMDTHRSLGGTMRSPGGMLDGFFAGGSPLRRSAKAHFAGASVVDFSPMAAFSPMARDPALVIPKEA